jgi:hypothetical protein
MDGRCWGRMEHEWNVPITEELRRDCTVGAPQERKRIQLQRDKIRSSELDPNKVFTQGKCTPIDARLKENKSLRENRKNMQNNKIKCRDSGACIAMSTISKQSKTMLLS